MRISDWSSDVCSSDLSAFGDVGVGGDHAAVGHGPPFDLQHPPRGQVQLEPRPGKHRGGDPGIGADIEVVEVAATRLKAQDRSEDRLVGTEWVRTCKSRWSQYHSKNKKKPKTRS